MYSRGFLRGACLGGWAEPSTPKELCLLHNVWSESNEGGFQSLARRSRYAIQLLKFECLVIASSLKTRFGAPEPARHLGPTPRGRLKFGRMPCVPCRTRTARNRRVKDARRSVTGPLSAASARYLCRLAILLISDFGAVKPRFLELATYIESLPNLLF